MCAGVVVRGLRVERGTERHSHEVALMRLFQEHVHLCAKRSRVFLPARSSMLVCLYVCMLVCLYGDVTPERSSRRRFGKVSGLHWTVLNETKVTR
jgi:hypothetical protein